MYIKELLPVHYLPEHIIWKSTDTIKKYYFTLKRR